MATLREYFLKDGGRNAAQKRRKWKISGGMVEDGVRAEVDSARAALVFGARKITIQQTCPVTGLGGEQCGDVIANLHLDFAANAKYISFYIPIMKQVELPEAIALNEIGAILQWPKKFIGARSGYAGVVKEAKDLVFTGQIYLYSERPVPANLQEKLNAKAATLKHVLTFLSVEWAAERSRREKPLAFISHDSRDKAEIAEPLALELQNILCPVWFDQFSILVGDSLRESIEMGLRECRKCIIILTPNFLQNGGWSKREYDSIFTRELIERNIVILPIWHNVTVEDVYSYSPMLADRLAVQWTLGVDEVARRIFQSLNANT